MLFNLSRGKLNAFELGKSLPCVSNIQNITKKSHLCYEKYAHIGYKYIVFFSSFHYYFVLPNPTERRLLLEALELADANEVALPPVDELDAVALDSAVLLPPSVLVAAIAVALAAAYYI